MIQGKRAGATQVNMGGGSDKDIFATTKEQSDAAKAAQRGLSSLNQAQQALPGAITGAGAEQRLALQKVATYFGADPSSVIDTETFRSAIAPQVAAMLKATVGSTQISNADREFAEKAAAGSILLDGQSIQKLINIMQAANSEAIRGFNSTLDSVYPESEGFARERALFGVPNVEKRYAAPIGPDPQSAFPDRKRAVRLIRQTRAPVILCLAIGSRAAIAVTRTTGKRCSNGAIDALGNS